MIDPKKILSFLFISIWSLFLVLGCDRLNDLNLEQPSQAHPSTQLIVSAASSLKDAIAEIQVIYQQEHPETEIIYNFASSGSLKRQIEQGAPVDIFISAASSHMDSLDKQGLLLTKTRRDLLTNQMVLVAPISNRKSNLKLDNFNDLTTKEITTVALGEPISVPAGKYAQEVLTSFGIAEGIKSKVVYGKDVRQVLNYVATGNVDAGIVYHTDVQVANKVEIVATAPESTHSSIIYPVAVIQDSDRPDAASDLIEFLIAPEAQTVFKKYGFITMDDGQWRMNN